MAEESIALNNLTPPSTTPEAPPATPPAAATTTTPPAATPPATTDWRAPLAGEDKDFVKTLERYSDPAAFGRAHKALVQKIQAGELKPVTPFPDKGSPDEQSAWRQANGVPEKPELYVEKVKLRDGVVPGETDKPGLERLAKLAAEQRWSQPQYDATVDAYYRELDAVTQAREAADDQFHQETDDKLRVDWGPQDYRKNLNAIHNFLGGAPEGMRERLIGGRTSDGKLIGDDPEILKWLAQAALDMNPAASILPANITPQQASGRLKELEAMAGDVNSEYNAPTDKGRALRKEYLTLLEAEDRAKSRRVA